MDFDEVREYVPGDEVRTIDWNVTARAGRPFVKKFTEERELTILLLVDVSASGNFGSARRASASWRRNWPASCLLRHPQQRQGRAVLSDFLSPGDPAGYRADLRRAMRQTNRRHDLVAVRIEDPHEKLLPDVGVLAIEDAETGEVVELDTSDPAVRSRFNEAAGERSRRLVTDLRSEGVDTLELVTGASYMPALQRFFKSRGRRRA
jgi:uncharacterized protein (DUF58 family)